MTHSTTSVFRARKTLLMAAALLGVITLGASVANAQTSNRTSSPASYQATAPRTSLSFGVSTPVIVPFGYSSNVGVGVLPGLQLAFGQHLGINLTAGYIHYVSSGEHKADGAYTEREVPVLLGLTYVFMEPTARARPYLTAKLGYTNSRREGHTAHWLTAAAGGGALIRLGRGFALDLGGDIVVSDLTGKADETVGLLLKIGLSYRL